MCWISPILKSKNFPCEFAVFGALSKKQEKRERERDVSSVYWYEIKIFTFNLQKISKYKKEKSECVCNIYLFI